MNSRVKTHSPVEAMACPDHGGRLALQDVGFEFHGLAGCFRGKPCFVQCVSRVRVLPVKILGVAIDHRHKKQLSVPTDGTSSTAQTAARTTCFEPSMPTTIGDDTD
jgi:hypothetical protein